MGGGRGALPELHGRPDHPGHHRRRPRRAGPPVRRRGRLAGGLRALDPVGAGGRVPRRPAAAGGRRRAAGRRRRPVRADEAAAAQRRPPGAGPPRPPRRADLRARGLPGPAVPRVPARLPRRGGDPDARPPCPGIDLRRYKADLVGRFANPQVRDTLDRIRENASDRVPQFLLPVLRANLARGGEIRRSAAVLAGWARSAEGADDAGLPLALVDPRAAELGARADRQVADPLAFLADPRRLRRPRRGRPLRRGLPGGARVAAGARRPRHRRRPGQRPPRGGAA